MKGLFITSTGTEIGKTLVTATLCHQLKSAGKPVAAIKPIISGVTDNTMDGSDTALIAASLGLPMTSNVVERISPFRYKAPLAPTMAAVLEGRALDYEDLIRTCRIAMAENQFTLVEGVGGSFVPLTGDRLVADWIKDLGLESLLVVGSYLGTISHTIATLEAMRARGLVIRAIVISESAGDNPDLIKTANEIRQLTGLEVSTIPRLPIIPEPWTVAPDLTHLL
ncbi:dethiobiotin synthase [Kordiimonas sp.]|uniref:dethiobiotin synthase n=1 Tax=Kordiimonas sp. TaxID=1970157 RepID=UPI003A902C22